MKKNTKFIWIYVAILFSFALILILFAGLTQNNYQKEITDQQIETAGVRKSLSSLTKENEEVKKELDALKTENELIKTENHALFEAKEFAINSFGGDRVVTEVLLNAKKLKEASDIEGAKALVENIDKKSLTDAQKYIYEMITGE